MEDLNKTTESVDLSRLSPAERSAVIGRAGAVIRAGGTVVFPTETVYGLGANALDPAAVQGIYAAKGRPSDNPLIIHVADLDLTGIVREVPAAARGLMDRYWPGPLTLILKKDPAVPDETTGGLDTVGVRMPDNEAALALIRASRVPLAAPSANISGRPSPTNFQRCREDLEGRVDMILGMDPSRVGLESTILDLSGAVPELLRPGAVTLEALRELLGEVIYQPSASLADDAAPRAPGMKYRHYAPRAAVTLFRGEVPAVRRRMLTDWTEGTLLLFIGGSLSAQESAALRERIDAGQLVLYPGVEQAAREIFERLRQADDEGYARIWIQAVPETGLGLSLMNRLRKAASHHVLEVER